MSSIPGSGRSPGGGHGNPLQYSCLENPRDGGAWWAAVCGVIFPYDSKVANKMDDDIFLAGMRLTLCQNENNQAKIKQENILSFK